MTRPKNRAAESKQPLAPKARVLIVDDHELVRQGLRALISSDPGLEVCGEAPDLANAMQLARKWNPNIVVVDVSLGDTNGLDLVRLLRKHCPDSKTIVSTMHEEKVYGERALRAGAHGYVCKQDPAGTVLKAIRQVLDGRLAFGEELTNRVLQRAMNEHGQVEESPISTLSDRELEVFRLIGQGLKAHEIAKRLHVSPSTLDTYRSRLKTKLNAGSGAELTRQAVQWVLENP
ncbi:MAG TPA: response regulator transcription factor [Pirellulales bacterium]|jgi:DNA-binding NarL/FixJ family response regulator|nr:response regulator transcription factor [Pirellulales bacterium]